MRALLPLGIHLGIGAAEFARLDADAAPPDEAAAAEHRMQGVDADQHAGEAEAEILQAPAQALDQRRLGGAGERALGDPAAAGEEGGGIGGHGAIMASGAALRTSQTLAPGPDLCQT